MSKKRVYKNKVLYEYKGFLIRQYNQVVIRVTEATYKKLIDAKIDFNLSHKDAILQNKVNIK